MKQACFDCFAGISGDMTLGALIDAGLDLELLKQELARLNLDGYTIEASKCVKNGITGTKVTVTTEEQSSHRHLRHIREIIEPSGLPEIVRLRALRVFETLAVAEAKVHNTTPEKIHFHEVGAIDAIIDIVGAVAGLHLFGIDRITATPIAVGTGYVECQHGKIPVPAPATIEILKGVPLRTTGIEAELTTPTGAAIIRTLTDSFEAGPGFAPEAIGYGAGRRDLEIPNLLRIMIGERNDYGYEVDRISQIEANIDDMSPEQFEFVLQRLLDNGALDVSLTPIIMKKSRPAIMLQGLAPIDQTERMIETIFRETSTLGVRVSQVDRCKLPRIIEIVRTEHGKVRIKVSRMNGDICNLSPEYEDCCRIATEHGLPLKQVYEEARRAAESQLGRPVAPA